VICLALALAAAGGLVLGLAVAGLAESASTDNEALACLVGVALGCGLLSAGALALFDRLDLILLPWSGR
jgi:hypothetical protein